MATAKKSVVKRTGPVKCSSSDKYRSDVDGITVEIIEWHKNAGDVFFKGETLCTVRKNIAAWKNNVGIIFAPKMDRKETILARGDGVFIKPLVYVGEKVDVDAVLAKIYLL